MKTRLLSALLCAALLLAAVPVVGAAGFTDISDQETTIAAATLLGLDIMDGMGDNKFSPDEFLTRAQVCAMAVRAMGLEKQVSTQAKKTLFTDVSSSSWYNGYVNLAYQNGVINGYGNGRFGPEDHITYGQMATILLRMLGYTTADIGSVWPRDYTDFADSLGLSDGLSLTPNETLTRGEAAILLSRALKASVKSSGKAYYTTINGVSSTADAILLDTSATYGGQTGLLMVYSMSGTGATAYYTQANEQSDALLGMAVTLLFDNAGQVVGSIPKSSSSLDIQIASATAAAVTGADGISRRVSSGAQVISRGQLYPYSSSGYLQLNSNAGKTVRAYYDDDGAIFCLYLTGGISSSASAAVAATTSPEQSLARELGISGRDYAITKNGVSAVSGDLAQYDVGYYDAASNTLRVSDYRVSGTLSAASPNVTAASTITVSGASFDVLECAWDSLGQFRLGDHVTLLLTDDGKVANVCAVSTLAADMVGVLSQDGRSVTLSGSGITLTSSNMTYDNSSLGSLVTVSSAYGGSLSCSAVSSSSAPLDLDDLTLGGTAFAPGFSVYEWAGSGYVYDLNGNQGGFSTHLGAIDWTNYLSSSYVSYYHVNSAGQVDIVLLDDVTGNSYHYGYLTTYTENAGINLGSGSMAAYNSAAAITNSSGTSKKYLCTIANPGSLYVGAALKSSNYDGYGQVSDLKALTRLSGSFADLFLEDGIWYAVVSGVEYPISEMVEIHNSGIGTWSSGEDALMAAIADGYTLTFYYDRIPSLGGQIRVISLESGS